MQKQLSIEAAGGLALLVQALISSPRVCSVGGQQAGLHRLIANTASVYKTDQAITLALQLVAFLASAAFAALACCFASAHDSNNIRIPACKGSSFIMHGGDLCLHDRSCHSHWL